jgi:hypothetical protein
MEALDYWKLCERITIFQAILLIIGIDPESEGSRQMEQSANKPEGYGAVKTALLVAAKQGILEVDIQEQWDTDFNGNPDGLIKGSIDIDRSYITVASIRRFLKERNFRSGFFSPQEVASPDYLDTGNPCYAPKLAAAVEAWTVVTGEKKYETESTPKQLMEKWLRENAIRFGLNKADGKLNEDAIAQITKIANWKPEGGASKTPGSKNPSTPKKRDKKPSSGP